MLSTDFLYDVLCVLYVCCFYVNGAVVMYDTFRESVCGMWLVVCSVFTYPPVCVDHLSISVCWTHSDYAPVCVCLQVTVKEQQEWKIPPCISNWKNNRVNMTTCFLPSLSHYALLVCACYAFLLPNDRIGSNPLISTPIHCL